MYVKGRNPNNVLNIYKCLEILWMHWVLLSMITISDCNINRYYRSTGMKSKVRDY